MILDEQVAEAIRAEKGDVAIDMLIPLIDFFNQHSDLDDSYGSGSMFVSSWSERLNDAVDLLTDDWEDDDLVEEALESIDGISSDYGYGMGDVQDKLKQFLSVNKEEDVKPMSKKRKV